MCGIFGLIRSEKATDPALATAVFAALGHKAVERGRHAAGFAVTPARPGAPTVRPAKVDVDRRVTTLGQVTIVKDAVEFGDLWDPDQHTDLVTGSRVAIGHTRWATQGNKAAVVNASPLAVGSLVGTHNGDIETRSVNGWQGLPPKMGSTDTEWLYQALNRDRKDRRKVVKTLKAVEGRAALAWIDQDRPDRVYLGRAALSPMSIAYDAQGNLYWASNPAWFRQIEAELGGVVGFHSITMVREGVLLTVDVSGAEPVLADLREFTPQCRPSDARMSDFIVWREFDPADTAADQAQENRLVAKARVVTASGGKKASGGKAWGKSAAASAAAFSGAGLADLPRHTGGPVTIDARQAVTEPEAWERSRSMWDDYAGFDDDEADDDFPSLAYDESAEAAQIEAEDAVLTWAEDGHDEALVTRLREQSTTAEAEAIMAEWNLSTLDAFAQFKEEVLEWAAELGDLATIAAAAEKIRAEQGDPQPLTQVLADLAPTLGGVTQADVVPAV